MKTNELSCFLDELLKGKEIREILITYSYRALSPERQMRGGHRRPCAWGSPRTMKMRQAPCSAVAAGTAFPRIPHFHAQSGAMSTQHVCRVRRHSPRTLDPWCGFGISLAILQSVHPCCG